MRWTNLLTIRHGASSMEPGEVNVFISSTWEDLQPERERVSIELSRIAGLTIVGMESFGARDQSTRTASLDEVEKSDIYLCIIGGRYGSGITEDEYNHASRLLPPLHRLIYFKDKESIPDRWCEADHLQLSRLEAFKAKVSRHTVSTFKTPGELGERAAADIRRLTSRGGIVCRILAGSAFQLRQPLQDFTSREREITEAVSALREDKACVLGISGMGGIGKTELALMIADQMRADYRDAQLFVEMQGTRASPRDPADALAACLRSMLGPEASLPTETDKLAGMYRAVLSGKRALIVLDNVANTAQARPLAPPQGCVLIITSREVLNLEGIKRITLGEMSGDGARDLLLRIAPRIETDVADRICSLCGRLPLALRTAGSLLAMHRDMDPKRYADSLQAEREGLGRLETQGLNSSLAASFNLSYARLRKETAAVFRQLSVFPASFDESAEVEVCSDSDFNLSYLLNLSLILFDETSARYRLHDLLHVFAANLITTDELARAAARHSGHYVKVGRRIGENYKEGGQSLSRSLIAFDLEWENLQSGRAWAACRASLDVEAAHVCTEYVDALGYLLFIRKRPGEQLLWLESALAVARASKSRAAEVRYLSSIAASHLSTGSTESALECYEQTLRIARETEDELGEANALGGIGNAFARAGEPARAIEYYHECLDILYRNSYVRAAGETSSNLGNAYEAMGDVERSMEFYEQALNVARELGNKQGEAAALSNLAHLCGMTSQTGRKMALLEQSLALTRETGDRRRECVVLNGLGNQYAQSDRFDQAVECFKQSLAVSREIGDRHCEATALGNLGNAWGDLGAPSRAIEFLNESLNINVQIGNRIGEGYDISNLGNVYYQTGDIPRAVEFHEKALAILRSCADLRGVAGALSNLGACHAALVRHRLALDYYNSCLSILREIRDPYNEGGILMKMGQLSEAIGERGQAISLAADALSVFELLKSPRAEEARLVLNRLRE